MNTSIEPHKKPNIRHVNDKLLFVKYICSHPNRNINIEYMIGFLLYTAGNMQFKNGFQYFKSKLEKFNKILYNWHSFIKKLVKDINTLSRLESDHILQLEVNSIIIFKLTKDTIKSITFDYSHIENIFTIERKSYDYEIYLINELEHDYGKQLLVSNNCKEAKDLHTSIKNVDQFLTLYS